MARRWSIRSRFILLALVSMVPIVVVIAFFLDQNHDRNQEELVATEATITTIISQVTTNYVTSNFQALDRLAAVPELLVQDDAEAVNQMLGEARRARPNLNGLFLVNAGDDIVGQSGTDPNLILGEIADQVDTTFTTGQRSVTQRIDLDDETSVIVLLVPVTTVTQTETAAPTAISGAQTPAALDTTDTATSSPTPAPDGTPGSQPPGTVIGVLGAVIQIDNLKQALIPSLGSRTDVAIFSSEQVIVATGEIRLSEVEFLDRIREQEGIPGQGGTEIFEIAPTNGSTRLATSSSIPLEPVEWSVIVTSPSVSSYEEAMWQEAAILVILSGLAILATGIAFGELTSRPLRDLANSADALRQGDYDAAIQTNGSGETTHISAALYELAARIREQIAGIEQNQIDRQRQTDQMRDLLRRTLRLQEDERRRIASEIHDAVSPLITGALYQARALQMTNGSTPEETLADSLQNVNGLLERASEELHGVIFDLRPPDLDDIGVVAAIEAYVSTIQRTGLQARLEVLNEPPPLAPEVRLGVYRIVQEALHNVLRHASADEAVVRLEYVNNILRVTIRDNGAGFDPSTSVRPTSLGLMSMRERAAAIGASFKIISRAGAGTAIVIERADTGDIMSDDIFADLASDTTEHDPLAESTESADNRENGDNSGPSETDHGRRDS